ncbi:MAG: TetR/AcrR family transcriptional regulator [Caulobacter sp.]|jgi:AcrR family transcriptional regulator
MMKAATLRSPRKPKGHGGERRQEILDAALKLFSERGIHAVSTRDIAAASGISQPALYAYFPSRDEIAAELCEQAFKALRARMLAAADGPPGREMMERMGRVYIGFGLEQPDAYRIAFMIEKSQAGEEMDPAMRRSLDAGIDAFDCFRQQTARLVAAGLTRETRVEVLTQSLWAAMHGLVSLLIARKHFPWVERETLISAHLRTLADGVLKPGV